MNFNKTLEGNKLYVEKLRCYTYNITHILVLVQPKRTNPFITERLLMGRKESNQTKSYLR